MVWRVSVSIAGGEVDRIEARTSDELKVELFEKVFPKSHWTGENPEAGENPPEFDFLRNAERVGLILEDYREHANDDAHGQCWADEFMKTYGVGKRLQERGLRPRVAIG